VPPDLRESVIKPFPQGDNHHGPSSTVIVHTSNYTINVSDRAEWSFLKYAGSRPSLLTEKEEKWVQNEMI
jgi:hypothetical protein